MGDLVKDTNKFSYEEKKACAELSRASWLNKAACFLKLCDNSSCLTACNTVLREDHTNVKALFRRAKAQNGLGQNVDCIRDLQRVLELDPANADARALLPIAKQAQRVADKE